MTWNISCMIYCYDAFRVHFWSSTVPGPHSLYGKEQLDFYILQLTIATWILMQNFLDSEHMNHRRLMVQLFTNILTQIIHF